MENYKVEFLQSALDDLEEIVLYIASDNKNIALKWHDELLAKVNNLATFPMMGTLVPVKKISKSGFRMFSIGSYIVFYKVYEKEKMVTILRVLNAKRDYPNFFNTYSVEKDKFYNYEK